jgi:hypothetical protein
MKNYLRGIKREGRSRRGVKKKRRGRKAPFL